MRRGIRHPAQRRTAAIPRVAGLTRAGAALAGVAAALAACAPSACSDQDERRLASLVEMVVADEPGPTADAAEDALVAAGRAAILYVETGLYDAEPAGRRRLIRVLTRIGDRASSPILAHLAARDPDLEIQSDARAGLRALETGPLP